MVLMGVLEVYTVSKMYFALFLYNESVMISSLAYNVFIHIKLGLQLTIILIID